MRAGRRETIAEAMTARREVSQIQSSALSLPDLMSDEERPGTLKEGKCSATGRLKLLRRSS